MSVTLHSSFLSATGNLAVKITPSVAVARRAFHLALLLDTSGSMDGERINALRRTLRLLIDAIKDSDVLTLISYSTAAKVEAEAVVVSTESRATLTATVDALRADGGTNLESALVALREVGAKPDLPAIDAVFILTDGEINGGLSSSSGLTRLLMAALPAGTPANTLGYGADHNVSLLRDMAVRTRGSYTFADADEVLPAIIGDIIAGLDTEVGRGGRLAIPDGWTCCELGSSADDKDYVVGVLIAEKPQWVILKGPDGVAAAPDVTFHWTDAAGAQSVTASAGAEIPVLDIHTQIARARVACEFVAVTELINNYNIADARTKLQALGAELDASPAKAVTFVIQLRAQIDEMLDELKDQPALPPAHGWPMGLGPAGGAGLRRMHAMVGVPSGGPALAPALSRLASNSAALGVQRGFLSGAGGGSGLQPTFSSPSQRHATATLTVNYSQSVDAENIPPAAAPPANILAMLSPVGSLAAESDEE